MKKTKMFLFSLVVMTVAGLTFLVAGDSLAACPDSIIGYWKLDEVAGPYVDFIGENDGAGNLAPTPTTAGQVNGAQVFERASTTGIDVDPDTAFNWLSTDSFSIEFWIKITTGDPGAGELHVAVGRREPAGGGLFLYVGVTDAGVMEFALNDSVVSSTVTGVTSVTADADWHHVVAVRDGTLGKNLLYVDGALDAEADVTYTGDGFISNTGKFNFGWFEFLADQFYLDGILDEIAIYSRALPLPVIQNHEAAGAGAANEDYCGGSDAPTPSFAPYPDDTISFWPLDETAGPSYVDLFGDNDGTGNLDPTATATDEGRVTNFAAQVFERASTTGIDVDPDTAFNWLSTDSFSIEFWIKITTGDPGAGELHVAVGRREPAGGGLFLYVGVTDAGVMEFALNDSVVSSTVTGVTSVTADADWHHVVAVRDGTLGKNLLYVDGALDAEADVTYTGDGFISNTGKFNFGWFEFLADQFYLDGILDEIAIYSRALPLPVIQNHEAAGAAGNRVTSLRPEPVAIAGANQTVTSGATVTLDGTGSSDSAGGTVVTYLWEETPSATVTLTVGAPGIATFTAPTVTSSQILNFRLTVTDNDGLSSSDTMSVTVNPAAASGGGGGGGGGCFINSLF